MKNQNKLYKYTNLPVLIDILQHKRLTLLDPKTWEDRNDSYYIEKYKDLCSLSTVLVSCFTMGHEKFHHWKVFSGDMGGVCIEFIKDRLLAHFPDNENIMKGDVIYKGIKDLRKSTPSVRNLPFLKRIQYKDEQEYRIIYISTAEDLTSKPFDIDLSCINQIKINPWMPLTLLQSVKNNLKSIDGCDNIRVYRTTLLENETWKAIADQLY